MPTPDNKLEDTRQEPLEQEITETEWTDALEEWIDDALEAKAVRRPNTKYGFENHPERRRSGLAQLETEFCWDGGEREKEFRKFIGRRKREEIEDLIFEHRAAEKEG